MPGMAGPARTEVVLFVDDEPDILDGLVEILAICDPTLRALTARDGPEALRILGKERVDAVVSDYLLPGLHGIAVLQEAQRVQPHARRVLMTAFSGGNLPLTPELGSLLRKPFGPEELCAHLGIAYQARSPALEDRLSAPSPVPGLTHAPG